MNLGQGRSNLLRIGVADDDWGYAVRWIGCGNVRSAAGVVQLLGELLGSQASGIWLGTAGTKLRFTPRAIYLDALVIITFEDHTQLLAGDRPTVNPHQLEAVLA